jgi:WhiB family redox-sensing transcriptional regulator
METVTVTPNREWRTLGACLNEPWPDIFFDEKEPKFVHDAKLVCATCPVIIECRTWAINNHEPYGVWGGLTTQERRNERQNRLRRARTNGYNTRTSRRVS